MMDTRSPVVSLVSDFEGWDMRGFGGRLTKISPWASGEDWHLVLYRWLVVAAGLYTVVVTWPVWQVRGGAIAQTVPMLPLWEWLPQFDLGWAVVASLLLVLFAPRSGIAAYSALVAYGIVADETRLQPPFLIMFLLLGTMPNWNAQMIGRAWLVALWFWAGTHKLLSDVFKPEGMFGFHSDIIPADLAKRFPPELYSWSTHELGVAIGWAVAITEISLGIMCLIPALRRAVGYIALVMHLGIAVWHCPAWNCSVLAWNVALSMAGFALIRPWREWPWESLKKCRVVVRFLFVFMLVYPAGYYFDWFNAYLSHCIYVPNTPNAYLFREGQKPIEITFMEQKITNLPLPPSQRIYERYFDKIKLPGDELGIADPRPWARWHGLDGRRLTYDGGELRHKLQYGHWINRDEDGNKTSEGDFDEGLQTGRWTFWYADGRKAMEGNFVKGQPDGVWKMWTPEGEETAVEYRDGKAVEGATDNVQK